MPLYEALKLDSVEDMVAAYDKVLANRRKRKSLAAALEIRTLESGRCNN